MSILAQLSQSPIKASPEVWIHKIGLLSRIVPEPEFIRETITLRKGLNIIWAEEPESAEAGGDIAGHSAGKTTLCRIIRYLLGEKTFSNKANTHAVKKAFPNGYVAAELYVKGQLYAVLRPLGENRNSYVLKGGTMEQVIKDKGEVAYQENYPVKLGLAQLIDDFSTGTVVRTNEPIQWGHILAWCARDQEARFQNIHDWRSSRSESDWPSFRFPKSDPLFVMRVALGLFLPDELKSEESLAEISRQLADAESDLERAKREPEYWRDHLTDKLRKELIKYAPNRRTEIQEAPLQGEGLFPDLKRLTAKTAYELGEKQDTEEEQIKVIDSQAKDLLEQTVQIKSDIKQLQALFQVDARAALELKKELNAHATAKKQIDEAKFLMCEYGHLLVGECAHVKNRQMLLSGKPMPNEVLSPEDLKAREAERKKVENQISGLDRVIKAKEFESDALAKRREKIKTSIETRGRLLTDLQECLEDLITWSERASSPLKFEKLKDKAIEIEKLKLSITAKQVALNELIAEHDSNRDLLSLIFSASAKAVLPSSAYDGVVKFQDRELNFQITKKGTMSGEAMETLAVLLGDLSCLIYNSLSEKSHLPGIMIHDSPREADLGLRLYHSFILFVAKLDQSFTEKTGCPFQYILTTTTPPPDTLKKSDAVRLQLDASKRGGLLFRTDLSFVDQESDLLSGQPQPLS